MLSILVRLTTFYSQGSLLKEIESGVRALVALTKYVKEFDPPLCHHYIKTLFMKAVLFVIIVLFCSCKTEQKVSLPSTDIEIYNDILKKNPHLTHEEIEDIMFKGE